MFWDPPRIEDQNGVITGYRVIINNVNQANTLRTTDINATSFIANGLEEFEAYNIQVAARTAIGLGPFSDVIRNQIIVQSKYL